MNRNILNVLNSLIRVLKVQVSKLNSSIMANKSDEWESGSSNASKLKSRIGSFAIDLVFVISVLSILTWIFY